MKHLKKKKNFCWDEGQFFVVANLAAVSSSMLASGFGSGNFTLQRDSVSLLYDEAARPSFA